MVEIIRKKDLIDFFMPYTCVINKIERPIKAGEKITLDTLEEINFIHIKYLYFKTPKIIVTDKTPAKIIVGSSIGNWFIITIIPFLILILVLISITDNDLGIWNEIAKYIGIFYCGLLFYFPTFGYKKYLSLEIKYNDIA